MKGILTSAEKALDILSSFCEEHQEYTANEISKKLKIPLSSTYKYLELLSKREFLSKNTNSKKFCIGLTLFKLGSLFTTNLRLTDEAVPQMRSLSALSGETIMLTVVYGSDSICIERVESTNRIRFTIDQGATLPLHAGASSKVLLAYQDEEFISEYIKNEKLIMFTKNTITNPVNLRKELEKIRDNGFAYSNSEADVAVRAISAPIFNHMGKVLAGITLVAPRERLSTENLEDLAEMVKATAKKISVSFGYDISENNALKKKRK